MKPPRQKRKKTAAVTLPAALERQIDALVGRRGRRAFLREAIRQEIERKRVLGGAPQPSRGSSNSSSAASASSGASHSRKSL
jgi:metal-responsive CopG/Arc/MetJ family transcriptional regulator